MAEPPAALGKGGDLEQKILQVLRDAGSPVKRAQLVKECQVPKKELNRVLYKMKEESKVSLESPATWCLARGGPEAEQQEGAVATPEQPGPGLSERQAEIFRYLEKEGPHSALAIAQALGMSTAKEVNPDLYRMKSKHLLDLDEKSKMWTIYRPEDSGRRNQSSEVIYQQNAVNVFYQNEPHTQIFIGNSSNTQIGHGNTITTQVASGENGATAPPHLPPVVPGDSSTPNAWGPQDIHLEQSLLRRVQLGHGNEMNIHGIPSEDLRHTPAGSPPVSATADSPEALFEVRMPGPGSQHEGDAVQKVNIKHCFLEDASIGNGNRMTVHPVAGGAAGSGDADPVHEASQPRSHFPQDTDQAAHHHNTTLSSWIEAMSLGEREPGTGERSFRMGRTPDLGSQ
ncbi:Z-DNA-binding protein 1 isoform X2 [Nycticebus coucang]|uniref:Z-DNA-binding protein 1 isoform X2 n=1 Tax=Nycticebus coucang TaxID=9470 RepID=UPI00234CF3CC|nr:Z-DNA-binding protein 1 isoform X2 [Nycticebus coucang]